MDPGDIIQLLIVLVMILAFVGRIIVGVVRSAMGAGQRPAGGPPPAPRDPRLERELEDFRRGAPPEADRPPLRRHGGPPATLSSAGRPPAPRPPAATLVPTRQSAPPVLAAQVIVPPPPLAPAEPATHGPAAPALSPLAASLTTLLTDPQSLRQVLIAQEILQRPEQRWRRPTRAASRRP